MSDAVSAISRYQASDWVGMIIAGGVGVFGVEVIAPYIQTWFQVNSTSWTATIINALVLVAAYGFGRMTAVALIGRG